MVDLVIRKALIYDGSGKAPFYGNVAVQDGKILSVGKEDPGLAEREVDAEGLALSPGFIDVHSHSDYSICQDPHRLRGLQQGITTELSGNCGISSSPVSSDMDPAVRESIHYGTDLQWESTAQQVEEINKKPLGVNQRYFTGHGALRANVMGLQSRPANPEEIAGMQKWLVQSMRDGTAGLSTGLSYVPGIYSDTHELVELAKTAGQLGGIYTTHSRSEAIGIYDCMRECIQIAREGHVPVNISHFKCSGKAFWDHCKPALAMLDEAIAEGLDITLDAYPYTACCTTTLSAIPAKFLDQGREAFAASLEDPNVVKEIYHEIYEVRDPSWDNSMYYVGLENFQIVRANETPWAVGLSYAQAAERLGLAPFDGMIALQKANHGDVHEVRFSMCEENVETILQHPRCMVGSDGNVLPGDTACHPRCTGTFPRYLGRYIRDRGILSREEGIRRLTSMPAHRYGLVGKGEILPGMDADLVLFDYDTILDHADYAHPFEANEGIHQVYVGGKLSLEDNQPAGNWNGKYLYPRHAGIRWE